MGGVSGSRVIDSWGQRMLTVMMSWAIPCGSTWGVVPVLAVAFFGVAGAPLVIVGIFAVTILIMWLVGRVFGPRLVAEGERAGMVMELPPYHRPHLGNVARGALLKSRQMFVRAIRVVALFAFAIWALTYTATGSVEGSVLYALGTAIEPVTRFFGMGWQTFTAWLCALVLKESALGVLSGLFTGAATPNAVLVGIMTGGAAAASNIGEVMAQAISAPEALAFIFAFTFNMPCAASVSATWGEVHSTKWTVITALFYICCSLLLGCVVYHVSALFLYRVVPEGKGWCDRASKVWRAATSEGFRLPDVPAVACLKRLLNLVTPMPATDATSSWLAPSRQREFASYMAARIPTRARRSSGMAATAVPTREPSSILAAPS